MAGAQKGNMANKKRNTWCHRGGYNSHYSHLGLSGGGGYGDSIYNFADL